MRLASFKLVSMFSSSSPLVLKLLMHDMNGARAGAAGMDGDGGVAAARAISSSGCADSRRMSTSRKFKAGGKVWA